jgi:hypothetical protein
VLVCHASYLSAVVDQSCAHLLSSGRPDAFMNWTGITARTAMDGWDFMTDTEFVKQYNALVKLFDG